MGAEFSSVAGGEKAAGGGVSSKSSEFSSLNYASKGPMSFSYASIAQHTNFSKAEIEALHYNFQNALPHDGSTTLTIDQFQAVLAASNVKNENQGFIKELFRAMDTNGDGVVNFVELCAGLSVMLKGTTKEKLALSFQIYDQDGSGKLKKSEMFDVMSNLNMSVKVADKNNQGFSDSDLMAFVAKLFAECDKDKDDVMSFSEFLTAVEKHPALVEFK
jgi:Ca2+-binding EF-hand superfamily protein